MNDVGSLLIGLLLIGALLGLTSFVVRGKAPSLPSRRNGGGGSWGTLSGSRRGESERVLELFFSVLAIANLVASESVSTLNNPGLVVVALIGMAVGYRLMPAVFHWVIVGVGAAAALADIALSTGADMVPVVIVTALFLVWIYGLGGR